MMAITQKFREKNSSNILQVIYLFIQSTYAINRCAYIVSIAIYYNNTFIIVFL